MNNITEQTTKNYPEEIIREMNSFEKGREEALSRGGEIWKMIRAELMANLAIRNNASFANRLHGGVVHTQYERNGIEGTFKRYGITTVWGRA